MNNKFKSVDSYISTYDKEVQYRLLKIREIIFEKAPDAVEGISYGMPAYKLNKKPLVYYAAFEKHIGFYATPTGHARFADELKNYKTGKGSVQFPHNKPLPYDLISKIVEFRIVENLKKFN